MKNQEGSCITRGQKPDAKPYKHAFSYGIIEIIKNGRHSAKDIIKAADRKMYQNKLLKTKDRK